VRSAAPEASRRVASGWDNLPPPLTEAVQPAREGLARKELRGGKKEKKKDAAIPTGFCIF